jgi:hypothetical protein
LQHGRDATVISPFAVGSLVVDFGLPGVVWPMAGPLVVQIIAVYFRGVEPAREAAGKGTTRRHRAVVRCFLLRAIRRGYGKIGPCDRRLRSASSVAFRR